ncbi:uncharacterized protein LOC118202656 [Stegodyphus dumicola]|uniref:uncharacterized protein LOC118202656 n=1 Tax=Stegodyphus dumicola TaxID=202533 RepID=UPI0015AED22E|nr:uncharacterized protein LOC118202656 [Stegodyphus dumicola]
MSSSELSDLHKIWLKFLNTTKTEEGEVWLDTFLAKYLELLCNSSIEENQPFSFQWKSSGNILAHQLLSDMYQLCESVKTNSSSESDHSTISETFQKYLLEGRGWKILWTLDSIGLQEEAVSHCNLVWLLVTGLLEILGFLLSSSSCTFGSR